MKKRACSWSDLPSFFFHHGHGFAAGEEARVPAGYFQHAVGVFSLFQLQNHLPCLAHAIQDFLLRAGKPRVVRRLQKQRGFLRRTRLKVERVEPQLVEGREDTSEIVLQHAVREKISLRCDAQDLR